MANDIVLSPTEFAPNEVYRNFTKNNNTINQGSLRVEGRRKGGRKGGGGLLPGPVVCDGTSLRDQDFLLTVRLKISA